MSKSAYQRNRSNQTGRIPRRFGFILLFGTRNIVGRSSGEVIDARCPRCSASGLVEKSIRPWFTVFFLPVFPVGASRRFTQCTSCQASFALPPEQLVSQVAKVDAKQTERGIAMYNSLRASPANSVTLNELMQLYASMNEFDQAVSAAADFQLALHNSEQCMTTLGRIYLAKHEQAEALKWFDLALARNPVLGEPNYFKAVAYLSSTPSDPCQAVAPARAARNAGYANADTLLRDVEEKCRLAEKT